MGAPNASIRVIIGMSIIKEGFDCSYANLTIDRKSFVPEDTITVTVDVKNTGAMAGKETVMLFTSDLVASITPDVRRLRAFRKINLDVYKRQAFVPPISTGSSITTSKPLAFAMVLVGFSLCALTRNVRSGIVFYF